MLRIGQPVSDAHLKTTAGDFGVHEYFEGSWGLLICYVADFSAVCNDELSQLAKQFHEFETRNVKVLALSCDSINSHFTWIEDIKKNSGIKCDEPFPFPIASDCNRLLSLYLNVLDTKCTDEDGIPLPCRATFVLAPDKTIQLIHFYPQTVGRDFNEILRSIDALQLTSELKNEVFTPSGWKPVSDCLVSSKLSKDDITKKFSSSKVIDLPSRKNYLCIVPGVEVKRIHEKIQEHR